MLRNRTAADYKASFMTAKGTPLLFDDFHVGNFYYNNKTYMENLKLNYNCYKDELLFLMIMRPTLLILRILITLL